MKKLIHGIVEFRKNLTEERRALFASLALGKRPDALFIGCADGRVVPNLFASTDPGDLFVLRNVGNLVPPASAEELSVYSALEFAVFVLQVRDIVVCGHSECGGMLALSQDTHFPSCHHFRSWLQYGEPSLHRVRQGEIRDPELSQHNQVSRINVLQQIEHLKTYDFIRERVENKQLRIHGWWFDIARADVYCYEPTLDRFVLMDEQEAKLVLERLG